MNRNECLHMKTRIVTDNELANSGFLRDGRATCFRQNIRPSHWLDHTSDLYRDYRGIIVDAEGHEIILNLQVLEVPFIREWFRDFCCTPCTPNVRPRVRGLARARARVVLTILRASFPNEAMLWGKRPANDNDVDETRYRKP